MFLLFSALRGKRLPVLEAFYLCGYCLISNLASACSGRLVAFESPNSSAESPYKWLKTLLRSKSLIKRSRVVLFVDEF